MIDLYIYATIYADLCCIIDTCIVRSATVHWPGAGAAQATVARVSNDAHWNSQVQFEFR